LTVKRRRRDGRFEEYLGSRRAPLAAQAPVFFNQIDDDFPFPPGEPAGQAISSSGRAEASTMGWSL
jgi:hypothetical protein